MRSIAGYRFSEVWARFFKSQELVLSKFFKFQNFPHHMRCKHLTVCVVMFFYLFSGEYIINEEYDGMFKRCMYF